MGSHHGGGWRRALIAFFLITSLGSACTSAPSTATASPGQTAVAQPSGTAAPAAGSGSAATPAPGSPAATVGAHAVPAGAIAPVDAASWSVADRLARSAYAADTTAALITGLARAGIGTYRATSSTAAEQPVQGNASPFRLLEFQVHGLAVGDWTRSGFTGAELDTVLPTPPGSTRMPSTSQLIAAYVAAADSPGGSLSRALMAGQDLMSPSTLRFPATVLVLFASDIATDGGRVKAPAAPNGSPAANVIQLAVGHPVAVAAVASGGVCSDTANWIQGTIDSLFNSLKLATPDNLPGFIVVSIWNFLVDQGQAFVQGLISTVTSAVLGTVRSIAGTIAAVAEQIASLVPYGLRVTAAGASGGATFSLGPDPLPGRYTASVSTGDLPEWPAVLADCASVAKVALPDFHAKSVPVLWGPLQAPADPLLGPDGSPIMDATDASGQATWGFTVSSDPGDPKSDQRNQIDAMPVTIHRPEVAAARAALTGVLLGSIPGILQPFVASIFAPYMNGLQARLNALLDARGTGSAVLIFHDGPKPTPTLPPKPSSSGLCNPNPVQPGSYKGTTTNTSSEIIDQGAFGGLVDTDSGGGKAALTVAADGSITGTWDLTSHNLFHETVIVAGVTQLDDRRTLSVHYTGVIGGTACNLDLRFVAAKTVSCVDSLKGDCSGERTPYPRVVAATGFGPPFSVAGPAVSWRYHVATTGDAKVVDDFVVAVTVSP